MNRNKNDATRSSSSREPLPSQDNLRPLFRMSHHAYPSTRRSARDQRLRWPPTRPLRGRGEIGPHKTLRPFRRRVLLRHVDETTGASWAGLKWRVLATWAAAHSSRSLCPSVRDAFLTGRGGRASFGHRLTCLRPAFSKRSPTRVLRSTCSTQGARPRHQRYSSMLVMISLAFVRNRYTSVHRMVAFTTPI